jgi:CheY-like chemotaxis protein
MELVLVVEDEHGTLELLQLILEAAGYRVATAGNGKSALEALAAEKPAAILSDYMMPHLTGAELGIAVRANPAWADIPFIMISATSEDVIKQEFSDYDVFVMKPYLARRLLQVVSHFVKSGRHQQGIERRNADADRELQRLMQGLRLGLI